MNVCLFQNCIDFRFKTNFEETMAQSSRVNDQVAKTTYCGVGSGVKAVNLGKGGPFFFFPAMENQCIRITEPYFSYNHGRQRLFRA